MTFKEAMFQDELQMPASFCAEESGKSFMASLVANQSPIIKFWFVAMVANLALFLVILR